MDQEIIIGSQWTGVLKDRIKIVSLESVPQHRDQEIETGAWIEYAVIEGYGKGSRWHCEKDAFFSSYTPFNASPSIAEEDAELHDLDFVSGFNSLSKRAHATAVEKGWWKERDESMEVMRKHAPHLVKFQQAMLDAANIALMHSELSEAVENIRAGYTPDDKIPAYSGVEAELSDCMVRIGDFATARNLNVAEALVAKMQFNKTRSQKHGGKLI